MESTQAAEAIAAYCREHADEMLATLAAVVNADSASANPRGVDEVAAILADGLVEAGCQTEKVPPPKREEDAWLADFFIPEIGSYDLVADHLIGRRAASARGRGHALLIGHMDTAFPVGEAQRNPFRVEGQRAYGCAIEDMKGGLIVVLYAVKALAATGVAAPRITVVYDSDEQAGSITARPIIEGIVRDDGVDWAFKTEADVDNGKIVRRRASIGVGLLEVHGIEAYAGISFWQSANAVVALAHKVTRLHQLADRERGLILTVGEFHGGRRRSVVPGYAYAKLDLRARTQEDFAWLSEQVRRIAEADDLPGTRGSVKIRNHRPAMVPTEKTEALMATVERAATDLGQTIGFVDSLASSDANFPGAMGVPTLDGFGPTGGDTMMRDEYIEIPSLSGRAALLAMTLHRLATGG